MFPNLCTVSLHLYLMVLKTISPGCGVRASLMLFLGFFLYQQSDLNEMPVDFFLPGVYRL